MIEDEVHSNSDAEGCPLCDQDAWVQWVDHGNRKTITCDICEQFQISRRAEEIVRAFPSDERMRLSDAAANAENDTMLVITVPTREQSAANPGSPIFAEIVLLCQLPGY